MVKVAILSDGKPKRKTPSELRGEQLKRRNGIRAPLLASNRIDLGLSNAPKKHDSKIANYINKRINEVYPVKKSSDRCRIIYGKEEVQDPSNFCKISNDAFDSFVTTNFPPGDKSSYICDIAEKENCQQKFRKIEKCTQSALRNVVELHLGNEKPCDSAKVDMHKALKGLVVHDTPFNPSLGKQSDLPLESSKLFCSEFNFPSNKIPLDFTLKTTLRLVSSSSVKRCHRMNANSLITGYYSSQLYYNEEQNCGITSEPNAKFDTMYAKALQSWVFPQSSLPASIISVMALSAIEKEKDFLSRRLQDWEDSFRNLYYMLRRNKCNIFYVHTTKFVVLFIGGNISGKKHSCNAYVSQSTHGLRSMLKKHDIHFSMPLCRVEDEQDTEEDLDELIELEKLNLGQSFQIDPIFDVDNKPQSLLAFIGNQNAHGLYDFLLNHRFLLSSFSTVDVPLLYAPVPFLNASLSVPKVKCMEMKKGDAVRSCSREANAEDGICSSIEIKDTILPPWIVSGICAAMSTEGKSFESSFTTEPLSIGLNIALDSIFQKSNTSTESSESFVEKHDSFGISEATPSIFLRSASLKSLKYDNGSFVSRVNPL